MDYRSRPLAEQVIIPPPPADAEPLALNACPRPRALPGAGFQETLVHVLASELARAFEEQDRIAFAEAIRAMTEVARGPRRPPS
jgi:hypothetical protein